MQYWATLLLALLFVACDNEETITIDPPEDSTMYFPPLSTGEWDTTSPEELGWNTTALDQFLTYLENENTRALIILKDGKIVVEEYFGTNFLDDEPFDQQSPWYWASAGKTLTATLVGIAQQDGLLDIDNPTSQYLGTGWTSMEEDKEQLITVKHQLTMTTGLDYNVPNRGCTLPSCLVYKADAGQQWFYHNAPYTLLEKVVENASGTSYNAYTQQALGSKIGLEGQWVQQGDNHVFWSTARGMARYGLMILNEGKWNNTEVLSDEAYYHQMVNKSQDLNPSYGYLWWLNGQESIIYPGLVNSSNTSLTENAPEDLFAGIGKYGQIVDIIPSENMVIVRMGESPSNSIASTRFHDEMWQKMALVLNR